MSASLVGSEMCIRDSISPSEEPGQSAAQGLPTSCGFHFTGRGSADGSSSTISGPEASDK
eukprot:12336762-Alexandrium_andersonii.AAC.1